MKLMSRVFRSEADRASVALEESRDGTSVGAESERWCIALIVVERDGSLVLVVEATRLAVECPGCVELSRRQHSSYIRRPLDLPWRGQTVRMRVHKSTLVLRRADLPTQDLRRTF